MKNNIKGVGVALVTPFDADGEVDYKALGGLVEHVIAGGVDYLVALGTTAETPTLTGEDKRNVVAFIKERNAGRLPLVVGFGGNSTHDVVKAMKRADFNGVDAVLNVTPYYNKPSQAGLIEHYRHIAGESPVPVIMYNVPSRTSVNMTAETTLEIANGIGNVLGIKEASGTITQISQLIKNRPEGFKVISGDDMMAFPLTSLGGDGVISVGANALPELFVKMVHAAMDGKMAEAAKVHLMLTELIEALFVEGNPVGVKTLLAVKGMIGNYLRLPLVAGTSQLQRRIMDILERERI